MCGLTLSVHPYPISSSHEALLDSFCQTCAARGPDRSSTYSTKVELGSGQTIELRLSASVLGLRGTVTAQPIIGKRGVLGWNGQVSIAADMTSFSQVESTRSLVKLILGTGMIPLCSRTSWTMAPVPESCLPALKGRESSFLRKAVCAEIMQVRLCILRGQLHARGAKT